MRILVISIFLLSFCNGFSQKVAKPYVVLVSLDGFRWDYPDIFDTPNLDRLAQNGVKAKSMQPSYPTKTFPNHYSIVTGLYPDHHGIVNNNFYDKEIQKVFTLKTAVKREAHFYGGNPIWNLAEQQGVKTACYYWPGSDTGVKSPSIFKIYDDTVSYESRINTVIDWLSLSESERPHLITLYFDQPDKTGHDFGPLSAENKKTVTEVDAVIGQLMQRLDALPIGKEINLIVLSDHGMASISNDKKVAILDYLQPEWYGYAAVINPIMSLEAKPEYTEAIANALKKVPNIKWYPSAKVPKRLHFGANPRALDFVIEAEEGFSLVYKPDQKVSGGTHGYDNDIQDMQAIFYAKGPNFKIGKKAKSFRNVSVYPLIAEILGLKTETIDGDLAEVKAMLRN
ncbi:alkaline phosphatase family protein [Flavobacterium sp. LM5]|uniref:alkaline phosphatase family protein n=1 Tax=Flavobacterium sp. LM5 TaxID=1938610 RepID=UPI000993AF2B|nr:ectonucleotide pyrophosphatase/phosphodiesterase [Flavobacterium sp. LM5]OOV26848.1 alkaline phosphatase family protein [Flavobacterium sp. LM5]